jgi:hypothetical protein
MLVPCEGGPWLSRLLPYPPPLEIAVGSDAVYVLDERPSPDGAYFVYVYIPQRL